MRLRFEGLIFGRVFCFVFVFCLLVFFFVFVLFACLLLLFFSWGGLLSEFYDMVPKIPAILLLIRLYCEGQICQYL